MKKILYLLLLISSVSYGQSITIGGKVFQRVNGRFAYSNIGSSQTTGSYLFLPIDTAAGAPQGSVAVLQDSLFYSKSATRWNRINNGGGGTAIANANNGARVSGGFVQIGGDLIVDSTKIKSGFKKFEINGGDTSLTFGALNQVKVNTTDGVLLKSVNFDGSNSYFDNTYLLSLINNYDASTGKTSSAKFSSGAIDLFFSDSLTMRGIKRGVGTGRGKMLVIDTLTGKAIYTDIPTGGTVDTLPISNRLTTVNNTKVDTLKRLNDSTLQQTINGRTTNILMRGAPVTAIVDASTGITVRSGSSGDTLALGLKTINGQSLAGSTNIAISGTDPNARLDVSKPPYNVTAGSNASLKVEQAIDSLWRTTGGTVIIPVDVTWDRPHAGSQKGALLRPGVNVDHLGKKVTLIGNCPIYSTDFGTDSLGVSITADVDSSTVNFTVTSSTGFLVGDTIYYRLQTAAYDAGEPKYFGYRLIKAVPDGTHITLDAPTGGNMTVASTITLNRRLIRVHNLASNINIKGINFYYDWTAAPGLASTVVSIQGGKNIVVENIQAFDPGAGLAGFQFCEGCVLRNSTLIRSQNNGNPNHGRGVTINESPNTVIEGVVFNAYQQTAIVHEANNPGLIIRNNTFNNNLNDSLRVAITALGSGNATMNNNYFKGYKHALYNPVLPTGKLTLNNTIIDRGTPFVYYEQQGVITTGYLTFGDTSFQRRKLFTKKFLIANNSTVGFDSLPKGRILSATMKVDDTTGITAFLFRRDATNFNNSTDVHSQFRSGQGITLNMTSEMQLGIGLSPSNLNYNNDKAYIYATNSSVPANDYATLSIEYLEQDNGITNAANATSYDAPVSVGSSYTLPTATTSALGGVKVDGSTITISSGVISSTGGASAFSALTDVTLSSPKNGQVAVYDSITSKFKNIQTPIYNVADWGMFPDSTDIRAKLIKLRDFVASKNGGTIFFPSGTQPYYLSDSILFTSSIHIMGVVASGPLHNFQSGGVGALNRLGPVQYSSNICILNGKNAFVFDSAANGTKPTIEIDHLTFTSTVAPGTSATSTFIKLKGMLQSPIIQYCTFYGGYVGINKISAYYAKINYNQFSAQRKVGLWMQNNVRTDTGDDFVFGDGFSSGTFNTAADTTAALRWSSGGGLKFGGFKIDACEFDTLHGFQYGVWIENPIDATSDVLINHGSIENCTISGIIMRGITAPYVRNILVDGVQIAPVGSRGPAIDIDHMEGVNVTNFDIRDWIGSNSSAAIKITNTDNVTIGDGIIRNYASNYDLTGSTNTNVLPKWDGYVHQGVAFNNLIEADNLKYVVGTGYVTPKAGWASGWIMFNGGLYGTTSLGTTGAGAVANLVQPLILDKDTAKVDYFKMAAGAGSGKILTSNAAGLASWQSGGSSQWTTVTGGINYSSGFVGIGKALPTQSLDVQFSNTAADGLFVKNTNSGAGARSAMRLINDAGEFGQAGMFSSGHATLPNVFGFEATKGIKLGTDQGVSSGGSSIFSIVTGGYSTSPSFTISGAGVVALPLVTSQSADTTNLKVAVFDASGNIKKMYWPALGGGGGSSQWTTTGSDIYYNTGKVAIGKTSASNLLDMQFSSTGTDGLFIKNTNTGAGAVTAVRVTNDGSELGQFSIFSSTHATFPNVTAFQATKGLQMATDVGVASGGTSSFKVIVGGYSSTPSFEIKGTGIPFYYGMKAGSGTPSIVVHMPDSSWAQMPYPSGGSGVTTVGTPNATSTANGADISSTTITMHYADATNPGIMKLYTSTGSSTDGTMDRNSINTALALKANLSGATFTGNITLPKIILSGSAPTIAAGAGAGTSPTVTVTGNANGFVVTVITGTSPSVSSVIATITYPSSFSNSYPVFSAGTATAAVLTGASSVFLAGGPNTCVFSSGTTALTASTTYTWYVHVMGN